MRRARALALLTLALALPAAMPAVASAQTAPAQTAPGPMTITRLDTPFVVEPQVKVTDLDGRTGLLAGASAGWLVDQTLFIGGAGYGLANPSGGDRLGYGGLVLEWQTSVADGRIRFGAGGLVGVGRATLDTAFSVPVARFGAAQTPVVTSRTAAGPGGRGGGVVGPGGMGGPGVAQATALLVSRRLLIRDDFFIAEPEATVRLRLLRHVGIRASVGYRFTGATRALDDRLDGVTGTVGLQIGGW